MKQDILSRAQGCFFGQCVGDALGQMVEFQKKSTIKRKYPNGLRDMTNGGAFDTLAGQPTDDTELALMLARSIVKEGQYNAEKVFAAYQYWYNSKPFDCGITIGSAMRGHLNKDSQANGSLMRISPLGIFGSRFDLDVVANWAIQDANLTHPNIICQKSAAIYTTTIAEAVRNGISAQELYDNAVRRSKEKLYYEKSVTETLECAATELPEDFSYKSGWVLLALQNAFYRLLHSKNTEEAIIETVNEGGDTDTTGAICGALLGAVNGVDSIPPRWTKTILSCRPSTDNPNAIHPRPECFWAVDVLQLAEQLLNS
ncbi:MAG: ADP-ribosylglycohydrolase family protein [Planctomycetaceae bacterium]|jgi:ADP-ribosylglycohydrolase|nr:ADP-ribosylglycohydrolase family protein [Planctomycetaceae bacterium]